MQRKDYIKFMNEYEFLGHMERVEEELLEIPGKTCYLPHHAVRNENSVTTKLRVVFDASCKTESGYSLNDTLLKGPVIQDELIYILSRFRTYKFVLTADIQKMYRQVLVTRKDSDMQRILWRADPSLPIQIYRLVTLTYGTVPASFLATGCLKKISEEEAELFPIACKSVSQDFYMDDYLGGADSIEKTIQLRDELICVMKRAGMNLQKWLSNESCIIENLSEKESSDECMFNYGTTKILGLYWNARNNMLQYKIKEYDENTTTNKRKILAETAAIFDPLGLIGPIIVKAKLMIQNLWRIRLGWDDPLPDNIHNEWLNYRKGLSTLNTLTIPRKIICNQKIIYTEIHGFADASMKCYGACIYLRCKDDCGEYTTNLICAKSRVAPLKTISLPRLELCAALLLVRMINSLVPKLNLNIVRKHFWSDSKIVLAWIASPSTKWKTFVAHRVGEIQDTTSINEWSHVRTNDNPADIISRGCDASKLANMVLWWHGPRWLSKNKGEWPLAEKYDTRDLVKNIPEARSVQLSTCVKTEDIPLFTKYSSLNKIIRITAYWLRFRDFLVKKKSEKTISPLRPEDLERANISLIKNVQKKHFHKEIKDLKGKNKQVSSKSKLIRLRPFIDENGIVRVGG